MSVVVGLWGWGLFLVRKSCLGFEVSEGRASCHGKEPLKRARSPKKQLCAPLQWGSERHSRHNPSDMKVTLQLEGGVEALRYSTGESRHR